MKLQQKIWQLIAIAIAIGGILSCSISSQANIWWNKESGEYTPKVARIINQATQPLVIVNFAGSGLNQVIPLSYLLTPNVHLQLAIQDNIPKIPNGYQNIFLFNPTQNFLDKLKNKINYNIESVYKTKTQKTLLWRLLKK